MGKQIIKTIFLMIVVFGIFAGIYIPISRDNNKKQEIKGRRIIYFCKVKRHKFQNFIPMVIL